MGILLTAVVKKVFKQHVLYKTYKRPKRLS